MTLPVYLILAFLLLVGAFVIFRVFVRRDYRRLGRLTLFSALLETFIFLCHGLMTLTYLPSDWSALHVSRLHAGMGAVPVILGLAVVIAGMTNVGLRNTFGQPGGLKQTEVYALTRNPQIIGYGLFVIGVAILWPAWYALGWVVLYAAIAHMMVLTEEEHLRNVYGEEYVRYCERVPRYLGCFIGFAPPERTDEHERPGCLLLQIRQHAKGRRGDR